MSYFDNENTNEFNRYWRKICNIYQDIKDEDLENAQQLIQFYVTRNNIKQELQKATHPKSEIPSNEFYVSPFHLLKPQFEDAEDDYFEDDDTQMSSYPVRAIMAKPTPGEQEEEKKPLKSKYIFHILSVYGLSVADGLPEDKKLQYHVLHSYWMVDPTITAKSPDFKKNCDSAKKIVKEAIDTAILNEKPTAPFFENDFWKKIEQAFFTGEYRSEEVIHINQTLLLNYKGDCLDKKATYLPPLRIRQASCKSVRTALGRRYVGIDILHQDPT